MRLESSFLTNNSVGKGDIIVSTRNISSLCGLYRSLVSTNDRRMIVTFFSFIIVVVKDWTCIDVAHCAFDCLEEQYANESDVRSRIIIIRCGNCGQLSDATASR